MGLSRFRSSRAVYLIDPGLVQTLELQNWELFSAWHIPEFQIMDFFFIVVVFSLMFSLTQLVLTAHVTRNMTSKTDSCSIPVFVFIPLYDSQKISSPISYSFLVSISISFLVTKLDQMPHWELSWDFECLSMCTQIRICFWSNCDHHLP